METKPNVQGMGTRHGLEMVGARVVGFQGLVIVTAGSVHVINSRSKLNVLRSVSFTREMPYQSFTEGANALGRRAKDGHVTF